MSSNLIEKQNSRISVWEIFLVLVLFGLFLVVMFYLSSFMIDFIISGANKVSQNVSALRTY